MNTELSNYVYNNLDFAAQQSFLEGNGKFSGSYDQLIEKGYDDHWVLTGLELKTSKFWNTNGFSLFFTEDFRGEVTAAVQCKVRELPIEQKILQAAAYLRENNLVKDSFLSWDKLKREHKSRYTHFANWEPGLNKILDKAYRKKSKYSNSLKNVKFENALYADAPDFFDGLEWWYFNPAYFIENWDLCVRFAKWNQPYIDFMLNHLDLLPNDLKRADVILMHQGKITPNELLALEAVGNRMDLLLTLSNLKVKVKNFKKEVEKIELDIPADPWLLYWNDKKQNRYTMLHNDSGLYDHHRKEVLDGIVFEKGGYGNVDWKENLYAFGDKGELEKRAEALGFVSLAV